jgi:hypothetical protein
MALIMNHTAPNGATGNYFRINRINGICAPGVFPHWEIWVGFYASADIRAENTNPLWQYTIEIPFSDLQVDPRSGQMPGLYSVVKNYAPFAGESTLDAAEDSPDITLDAVKATKITEINKARLTANTTSFPYLGKQIACDALSRSDIDGVNGYVALMGAFPSSWVGKWKAADDTYLTIETLDDWKAFYSAMVNQGQSNFVYSQWLKQQVAAATTAADVDAVYWGLTPPAP